ncbi:unnamed protein product [Choristocarpus tenellus]
MYGGGALHGDDGSEEDEDISEAEDDEDMGLEQEEQDEDLGGGLRHSDFFGDDGSEYVNNTSNSQSGMKGKGGKRGKVSFKHSKNKGGEEEEEEEEREEEELTLHAEKARKMKLKVSELERELLAEKPWALKGEIRAKDRPENSLLEASVDVDRVARSAPPPTVERTMSLLDMIKKRCIDQNWDDVTPRNIAVPTVRKEAPELSQEKSKEGLGDIYEKEYMKTTMGIEEDDKHADLKKELKILFTKLTGKLDALCNFHYTPKPVIPEMKVQADVAAISMEEVLPASVADGEALAPEEVYSKKRGRDNEFLEDGEMNQEERKRARGSKKAARRKARRQVETEKKLVAKLNPGLGNKYEKDKMLRDIQSSKIVTSDMGSSTGKEFSTSHKFFSQLQQTVRRAF